MTTTIVHAGFHKTGTTSIQEFLTARREWLAAQNVFYEPDGTGSLTGHHRLACWLSTHRISPGPNDLFTPERERYSSMLQARSLKAENFSYPFSTTNPIRLISSEIFNTFDLAELIKMKTFLGSIDRFILYVRNGIGFIYSCWASKVRWGHIGSFDAFLKETLGFAPNTPLSGALQFVDVLSNLFGPERISIRNFNTALQHKRGIVGDFVEGELGLAAPAKVDKERISNRTISWIATEVQRALNLWNKDKGFDAAAAARGRLNEALHSPDGEALMDEFRQKLETRTKLITIRDMHPTKIGMDGIAFRGSASFRGACEWHFPFDEPASFVPTHHLVEVLAALPGFKRLAQTDPL